VYTVDLLRALVLGLIQGATEFVPVSSSGHLVLVPWLLQWPESGLLFDTIVHWGTLFALLVVFWKDLWRLVRAAVLVAWRWLRRAGQANDAEQQAAAHMAWWIIIGTVPAVLAGWFFEDWFERLFGTPVAAAAFLLVTAVILTVSERWGRRIRPLEDMNWKDALLTGVAQAAAIAPGVSRSGVTMAMGLARGLRRADSARFAFLLAIPIIFGAGVLQLAGALSDPGSVQQAPTLLVGFLAATASGYLCIRVLLRYLQRRGLYPFAVYCALLGAASLVVGLLR
jgi:undecaprenyl-diphosphatase